MDKVQKKQLMQMKHDCAYIDYHLGSFAVKYFDTVRTFQTNALPPPSGLMMEAERWHADKILEGITT
jgi:hypothetical protein